MAKPLNIDTPDEAPASPAATLAAADQSLASLRPPDEDMGRKSLGGTRSETSLRASPREMGSVRRAEARAAEIRAHGGRDIDAVDKFFIPLDIIPEGWSYEWKRYSVAGKVDHHYQSSLKFAGWEPVEAERHPEMMPEGAHGYIEKEGMLLMERPISITLEARAREHGEARQAMRAKEIQLGQTPSGTLPRDANPAVAPKVSRSVGPVEIPADA